jgi:DnaJ-class molecular chaperone
LAEEDYYKVLEVSRSASAEEIQKAYRKLARKYHPDLHAEKDEKDKEQAKQQFQKIQQAYDVLSDPEKRKMYDQFGSSYEQFGGNPYGGGGSPFGGGGAGGFDFSQIFGGAQGGGGAGGGFEQIFKQMGGMPPGAGQPRGRAPAKGQDLEQEITVPFAVSVLGGQHQLSFQRRSGKIEKIDVKIPAGIEPKKKIRLRGQGLASNSGGPKGDLMVTVKVAPHPSFTRKGMNLLVTVPITIIEAVEGAKVDIPTPYGTVALTVPPGCSSGKSLRLKGMGIKGAKRTGDLIASLHIMVPDEISDSDREHLKQLDDRWNDHELRSELAW